MSTPPGWRPATAAGRDAAAPQRPRPPTALESGASSRKQSHASRQLGGRSARSCAAFLTRTNAAGALSPLCAENALLVAARFSDELSGVQWSKGDMTDRDPMLEPFDALIGTWNTEATRST